MTHRHLTPIIGCSHGPAGSLPQVALRWACNHDVLDCPSYFLCSILPTVRCNAHYFEFEAICEASHLSISSKIICSCHVMNFMCSPTLDKVNVGSQISLRVTYFLGILHVTNADEATGAIMVSNRSLFFCMQHSG